MSPAPSPPHRRHFLLGSALLGAATVLGSPRSASAEPTLDDDFPLQEAKLVREMVGVSHGNAERVRELLRLQPDLAKAAIDWGFGDWESALGAASHTGHHEIALLLLAHGARPTLFSAAMLGQLAVVRAMVEAYPDAQGIPGPHGISLLAHARAGGDRAVPVVAYLEALGGADGVAEVPLESAARDRLLGRYSSPGLPAILAVTVERDHLLLTVGATAARRLIHRGDRVFHPAGAPGVRVSFSDGAEHRLEIVDGNRRIAAVAVDPHH